MLAHIKLMLPWHGGGKEERFVWVCLAAVACLSHLRCFPHGIEWCSVEGQQDRQSQDGNAGKNKKPRTMLILHWQTPSCQFCKTGSHSPTRHSDLMFLNRSLAVEKEWDPLKRRILHLQKSLCRYFRLVSNKRNPMTKSKMHEY